jgi:hypothetical protein
VCLDSREILIEIETSRFHLDINVQTKKSPSRLRDSSRSENFGVSRQFVSISIKKCVDFCIFSSRFLNPSRLFIIFRLKRPRQCQDFWTNLDNLDKNLDASKSRLKNLDFKNLDREKKEVDLDRRENLDYSKKLDLDWSRLSRPPCLK